MKDNLFHHVIILGCGRSGTSIFGELFEHLEPYSYFSEPYFEELLQADFSRPIAVKVPKESTGYRPSSGLSFPLKDLLSAIPGPRSFFWQVRHPLDTICSLRVGISKNWGHHPRPPDWQEWRERLLIERCAYHWDYINSLGYEKVRTITRVTHFEDMVRAPRQFANTICKEINLKIKDHESELATWAKRVQNTNNTHFNEAKTSRNYSRADHRTRIDRWKENLSRQDIEKVLPMVRNTAKQFGYFLDDVECPGLQTAGMKWHHSH